MRHCVSWIVLVWRWFPRLYFSWLLFSFPFFLLGSFSTFSSLSLSALTLFMMAGPDLLADLCSVQLKVSPFPSPVSQPLLCLITINIYYYKQIIFDISYYQQYCYILSINNTHSGMAGWLAGWCGNSPRFFWWGQLDSLFFLSFSLAWWWWWWWQISGCLFLLSCFLHFGCVLVCHQCCCFFAAAV